MVAIPLPNTDDPVEQGVQRIWTAMEGVSEKGQTLYWPLLAYMNADSMAKHVQPWQQILAFIAHI
ncbi:uncharacterized protein BDW43DRAFT_316931 [Aspergillus alliaceus]|uniref:uncharacterized protein n=1 Tax=Petromyces alliaceus TaxID=209559 RepID=UPI0012A45085|nr:uncharacterized protein BDW43DRAFT_316931 [Aspergillus alliaceus]KAB8227345.1 hypothetical protein BDW43DRAFT_316931 [Aspergillus alliaceus]